MTKVYDTATDLITFARGSSAATALRRVGYGENLVDNDDFTSGLTSWEQDETAFSVVGDELVYDASGDGLRFGQVVNFAAGKVYQLTFDATISSTFRVQLVNQISNDVGAQIIGDVSTGANTVVFVPNSSFTYLVFRRLGKNSNSTFDNISVKEVIFDRATDDLVLFNHPDDIPRIEYAADGTLKGLLIEEQRSNFETESNPANPNGWGQINLDYGTQTLRTKGPDGVTDSIFKVQENTTTGTHYFTEAVTTSVGTNTFSCIVKDAGDGRWVYWRTNNDGANQWINVNPATGEVTEVGTAVNDYGVIDLGNGFYRLWFSCDSADGLSGWVLATSNTATPGNSIPSFTGTSEAGFYCGFVQVEAGSFATSYIPTSGGQSTRSPDIASIPVSAFGYNQEAGTVVVEFDMIANHGAAGGSSLTQAAFGFHDGTSSNRLELWTASVGQLTLRDRTASANFDAVSSGNSLEQSTKSAASYASGEASKLVVNGGTALVAGTATTPPAYSTLLLGDTQNINAELNGHIKSMKYYPRRLTNTQLQELTS